MCIQFGNAKSPVFMRVRRTVPQFTFSLSAHFVNSISSVSTGFFRFFSVLFENRYIFLINSKKIQVLAAKNRRDQSPQAPAFLPAIAFVFLVVIPAGDLLLPLSLLLPCLFPYSKTSSSRPKLFTVSS
jgi:hypothetical protein